MVQRSYHGWTSLLVIFNFLLQVDSPHFLHPVLCSGRLNMDYIEDSLALLWVHRTGSTSKTSWTPPPWDHSRLDQSTAPDGRPSLFSQIYSNHFFLLYLQTSRRERLLTLLSPGRCPIPSDFSTSSPFFASDNSIQPSSKVPS